MEGKRQAKDLVMMALFAAMMLLAQISLAVVPNVELVSLLCILYTLVYRKKALIIIYTFVLLEGLIYGFGIWWINYLYVWTILWGITMLFRSMESVVGWAIVSASFGLAFGLLTAIPYLFIGGVSYAISYWISGIAFDIPHSIGNAIAVILLFKPLCLLFEKALGVKLWKKTA